MVRAVQIEISVAVGGQVILRGSPVVICDIMQREGDAVFPFQQTVQMD